MSGASPNVTLWGAWPVDHKVWLSLRKSGTSYYVAISLDGEAFGPESSAITWAGTVNRVAMSHGTLGTSGSTRGYVDVDWFNKIA